MFPNVEAEQRRFAAAQWRVLIGRGFDLQLLASMTSQAQPLPNCPSAALLKLSLNVAKFPNAVSIALASSLSRFATAILPHHLPEERMVVMAAAIVSDWRCGMVFTEDAAGGF